MVDAKFVTEAMEERSARAEGYDFSKSIENIKKKRFNFGARNREANAVDIALANLFECLSVECSGILVHPQWKHFSHIEIVKNDQLRLSNGIWRSWHMQFQKGRVPSFCFFDIEAQLNHHKGQKSVVLEGQYWKRRVEAVAREYRKWRIYHRDKNKLLKGREPWLEELLKRAHGDELGNGPKPQAMQVEPARPSFMEDFPDALFLTTKQDSPGEPTVYTSTADVIPQPNLDMLNPTLEDLLEKFEPMEVMLSRSMGAAASFFSASNAYGPLPPPFRQDVPPFSQQFPTPMQTSEQFASPSLLLPTPPKPLTQTQPPFASQFSVGHATAPGLLADQQYTLSPTTFLALPSEQPKTQEVPVESCMDIGVPQMSNYAMKPESNVDGGSMSTCTHTQFNSSVPAFQSQHQPPSTPTPNPTPTLTPTVTPTPTPTLSPTPQSQHYTGALNGSAIAMQDAIFSMAASNSTSVGATPQQKDLSISSLLGLFGPDAAAANLPQQPAIQSSPLGSTPLTHVTSASRSQQAPDVFQFPHPPPQRSQVKLSPATEMHPSSSQPFVCVSSGSKPTDLASRPVMERGNSAPTQFLHEQVRKLSEQQELQRKELEEQQYLAQKQYSEVMQQFLGQKPSEEQQQVLRSVLGDPSLLDVLRTLLLSTSVPTGTSNPGRLASNSSSTSPLPQQTSPPGQTLTFSPFTSPTQSTKDMKMAAAANTSDNSAGTAGLSLTPTLPGSSVLDTSGSKIFPFTQQRKLKSIRSLSVDEKEMYQELRRQSHISAEQKRRGSIKQGFDHLQSLVINLSAYPSGKVSKATILEKSIEHINHVHQERESREREIAALKQEIKELNAAIARCQEQLPASGAPITRQRFEENRQRFKEYIQRRTLQNYKFWMFSIILQQLFESYNSMVSTGNSEELCRTVLAWFEQNCTLPSLRPVVMSSLRELSMKTSILTDPSQVPHQLAQFAKQDMQRKRLQNLPHLM